MLHFGICGSPSSRKFATHRSFIDKQRCSKVTLHDRQHASRREGMYVLNMMASMIEICEEVGQGNLTSSVVLFVCMHQFDLKDVDEVSSNCFLTIQNGVKRITRRSETNIRVYGMLHRSMYETAGEESISMLTKVTLRNESSSCD